MVSTNPCPFNSDDPSTRNQQTINMASFLLNIPMFIFSDYYDPTGITAQAIFENGQFNGQNIVIFWEHTNIQQLILNLAYTSYLVNRIIPMPANLNSAQYNSIYSL